MKTKSTKKTKAGDRVRKPAEGAPPGSFLFPDTFDPIATEIKRARDALGLSHTDLHRATGISRTVLIGYERGRTKPGAREIRLLSTTLKVTPTRLLFGSEEPFKLRPSLQALLTIKRSPALIVLAMMSLTPMILAHLSDEDLIALVSVVGGLLKAQNRDAYLQVSAFIEAFLEEIGEFNEANFAKLQERFKDPEEQKRWNAKVTQRLAEARNK